MNVVIALLYHLSITNEKITIKDVWNIAANHPRHENIVFENITFENKIF